MKTIVTMKLTNQVTASGKILAKKFSVLLKPSKSFVNKTRRTHERTTTQNHWSQDLEYAPMTDIVRGLKIRVQKDFINT